MNKYGYFVRQVIKTVQEDVEDPLLDELQLSLNKIAGGRIWNGTINAEGSFSNGSVLFHVNMGDPVFVSIFDGPLSIRHVNYGGQSKWRLELEHYGHISGDTVDEVLRAFITYRCGFLSATQQILVGALNKIPGKHGDVVYDSGNE